MPTLRIVLAACALALLVACGGPTGVTSGNGDPDAAEPTSPAAVLRNVETGLRHRYAGLICKSLDCNGFNFWFNPSEVGMLVNDREVPTSWNYVGFSWAVDSLCGRARDVDVAISLENVGTPAPGAKTFRAGHVAIEFRAHPPEGYGYLWEVGGGWCDFDFASYAGPAGKTYWRLTGWHDHTYGPASMEFPPSLFYREGSLGYILALYYL